MPPEPSLIEAKHLKLLTNATGGLGHIGTTLYAHLVGTARLLETWGRPLDVCLAGLCHSIYGTQSYAEAAVSFHPTAVVIA